MLQPQRCSPGRSQGHLPCPGFHGLRWAVKRYIGLKFGTYACLPLHSLLEGWRSPAQVQASARAGLCVAHACSPSLASGYVRSLVASSAVAVRPARTLCVDTNRILPTGDGMGQVQITALLTQGTASPKRRSVSYIDLLKHTESLTRVDRLTVASVPAHASSWMHMILEHPHVTCSCTLTCTHVNTT